jgi:RNA polymerase sigma factor (sigma-70 family)
VECHLSVDAGVAREGVRQDAVWDEVYRRVRPSLVRALAVATGTYDHVEDAIQDAFADAIIKAPKDLLSPEGWLYAVALNKLRRYHGRNSLLRRLRIAAPRPINDLDQALFRADLTRVLLKLSPRDRELLVAKHYVGMTQEEIARHMRIPRGTVSAAISRAAAHLRDLEAKP